MQIKRAAILWAGFGRRISREYGGIHKATIMLKGKTLAWRLLDDVYKSGITEIIPVLGYRADDILGEIDKYGKFEKVLPVYNNRFRETNNLYSLCQAKEILSENDFVVINGDMVFDYHILKDICHVDGNAVATDTNDYQYLIDSPRVLVDGLGRIIDIGRHLDRTRANGYAIGIYKFSREYSSRYFRDGISITNNNLNAGYHEPLKECFADVEWNIFPTQQYEWMDIDEKSDVEKAEAMIWRIENR